MSQLFLAFTVRAAASLSSLPWDGDRAALAAAAKGVTSHKAAALETALKHGARFFPNGAVVGGRQYLLADGDTEVMLVRLAAAADIKRHGAGLMPVEPVPNFYPEIALTLARFYAGTGRPADAVRVLDQGLSLSPSPEGAVGAHVAAMMAEKGAALVRLKKYDQALDIYDQALASHVLSYGDRAMLKRGQANANAAAKSAR